MRVIGFIRRMREGSVPMATTAELQTQLRASIEQELAARTAAHQQRISRLLSAREVAAQAQVPAPSMPLVLLAHGDSWFDYPLNGNSPFFTDDTDIIAHLQAMGEIHPLIHNLSHWGDATTNEMELSKQQRMITALREEANWLPPKLLPDAILFSGGGNDIVGGQFCIYLDYNAPGSTGIDADRLAERLDSVRASYQDLIRFRNRYAPGVPIFTHCYDFAIPDGRHPSCVGPWLKPSLDFTGWTNASEAEGIVRRALLSFKNMLAELARDEKNDLTLIDTQGVLDASDWANELHPYPEGFRKLAARFTAALSAKFAGRI